MRRFSRVYLPIFCMSVFALLLDGIISAFAKNLLQTDNHVIVPQLTLSVLLFFAVTLSEVTILPIAVVIGLMYDSFFGHIWSFYTLGFIIAVLSVQVLLVNAIREKFLIFIALLSIESLIVNIWLYIVAQFLGVNRLDFGDYVIFKCVVTMLFNVLLFLVAYIPLKRFSLNLKETLKTLAEIEKV